MVDYLPGHLPPVSVIYDAEKLEVLTYHLQLQMALASFPCQVCILWLNVIDGRGENCRGCL